MSSILGRYESREVPVQEARYVGPRRTFRQWLMEDVLSVKEFRTYFAERGEGEMQRHKVILDILADTNTKIDAIGEGVAALVVAQANAKKKKPAKRKR